MATTSDVHPHGALREEPGSCILHGESFPHRCMVWGGSVRGRVWIAVWALGTSLLILGGCGRATDVSTITPSGCPWLNAKLPTSERVAMLLPRMTLVEKLDLMGLANVAGYENATTAVPALCIPQFTLNDGPAGIIAGPPNSHTQLPSPIGIGASFDVSLAQQYGGVLGAEAAAKGIDVVQAPDLNIARVPESGRNFETLGEDPYLTSQLGLAIARGIESQGVGSMPKHFAVYNQETYRNTSNDDSIVSQRALHEIYLPAFQTLVEHGDVSAIMCSYAEINGLFACEDPLLLTQILVDSWGFTGFVRTDLGASHNTVDALNAGTDQLKPAVPTPITSALESGQISTAEIDNAVGKILTQMFHLGVFNRSAIGNANTDASTPAHVAFAETAAEKSIVLLKNANNILPLSGVQSIAVIGADAGADALSASPPPSSDHVSSDSVVTPYQGIVTRAANTVTVTYAQGVEGITEGSSVSSTLLQQAVAQAAAAQVAVVFVGLPESEGSDLPNLSLPGGQDQLIEAVAKANPHTIVVINSGGPVVMPWLDQVQAVLEAWYPGQQDGNAVAAVLFGNVDPSGKLPITFPTSTAETPVSTPAQFPGVNGEVHYSEGLDVGYRWYDQEGVTPLFPFGFGLSYTTFSFSNIHLSQTAITSLGSATVTATVTNTGTRSGAEVAQLYLDDPASIGEPPLQLKGFQRVSIAPGSSAEVSFTLTPQALAYWDTASNAWNIADGTYHVWIGSSSASLPLEASLQVGSTTGARSVQIKAPAQVEADRSFTVDATLTSGGNLSLANVRFQLKVPSGWTVRSKGATTISNVAPNRQLQTAWQVTPPTDAQSVTALLGVTAMLTGSGGTTDDAAYTQVSVEPVVTVSAQPSTLVMAGGQGHLKLHLTNTSGSRVNLSWSATASTGQALSIHPSTGSASLGPGANSSPLLTIGGSPTNGSVAITLNAKVGSQTVDVPPLEIPLSVAVPSLAAAFNNVGITADDAPTVGDFEGTGTTFSAQALQSLGLEPGGTVHFGGLTFTWPNAPAGQPDNVVAQGQTIALSGQGSKLGFLGASDFGNGSGTGVITYTDGTTQPFTLPMTDWYATTPAQGDQVVAIAPYRNSAAGQSTHSAAVYFTEVPLNPVKTVSYVTLPNLGPVADGQTVIHIFAMAIGH